MHKKKLLTTEERFNWLKLLRCHNIGPRTFFDLLNMFGNAENALSHLKTLTHSRYRLPLNHHIEEEIKNVEKFGARMIYICDDDYPAMLANIHNPPPIITIKGDATLLKSENLALVGSRSASSAGNHLSQILAAELTSQGYCVVSGLARGIDTSAHIAALEYGPTIAVIAGGMDHVYPQENKNLYHAIAEKGCIVSENAFGARPLSKHFPARNRIISGLSQGVIIIEAKENSGSLITANFALDQGREVFAVPGSPLETRSSGCNKLIQQGAILVQSIDDITNALAELQKPASTIKEKNKVWVHDSKESKGLPKAEKEMIARWCQEVVSALSYAPMKIDDLQNDVDIPAHYFTRIIVSLELQGIAERVPFNRIVRKP